MNINSKIITVNNFLTVDVEQEIINNYKEKKIILSKDRLYSIPNYQREFKWNESRVKSLIDDVNNQSKFLGNIFLCRKNSTEYEIIDGQQRLTVILMILKYISNSLNEENNIDFFRNDSYAKFSEQLKNAFSLDLGIDEDPLNQTESFKKIWEYIPSALYGIDLISFRDKLKNSQLNIISAESNDLIMYSKIFADYFIDLNNKNVSLDEIDIIKAYIIKADYNNCQKWVDLNNKVNKLNIRDNNNINIKYPLHELISQYFVCKIKDITGLYISFDDNYKSLKKQQYKGKTYPIGTDVETFLKDSNYKDMLNDLSKYLDFVKIICESEVATQQFKNIIKSIDGRKSDIIIKNLHWVLYTTLRCSDVAPKVLIMKYYFNVICNKAKKLLDCFIDIFSVATSFSVQKSSSKGMNVFKSILLRDSWFENLKWKSAVLFDSIFTKTGFDKMFPVEEHQNLSRRFRVLVHSGSCSDLQINGQTIRVLKVDQNEMSKARDLGTRFNDEHLLIPQSENIVFKYNNTEQTIQCPILIHKKYVYLCNIITLDATFNSSLGNKQLKEKIIEIDSHNNKIGDSTSKKMFELINEVFSNGAFPKQEELDACADAEAAKVMLLDYYENTFDSELREYISKLKNLH